MDVKEMREVAEAVSEHTACVCDSSVGVVHCPSCDARYLAKLMLVLTCPDPLTLDAAVKVLGREPDRKPNDKVFVWDKEDICFVRSGERTNYVVVKQGHWYLPTVGQFALLVAAAKMGEKA